MGWRSGGVVTGALALALFGVLAAATPAQTATAPLCAAAARAGDGRDAQPTLSAAPKGASPASGSDARAVDSDDDSDGGASLVAATVAVERPRPRRLAYRAAANSSHAPPDTQPLLRPPSPDVG